MEGTGFDPSIRDWRHVRLRLHEDIAVWRAGAGGRTFCLERRDTQSFFHIGYEEYVFLSLLDGATTADDVLAAVNCLVGAEGMTEPRAAQIVRWAIESGIAEETAGLKPAPPIDQENASTTWLGRFNPFWMRFPLTRNQNFFAAIGQIFGPLFTKPIFAAWIAFLLVASTSALFSDILAGQSTTAIFAPYNWAWLIATTIGLKTIHEGAHAAACYRFGGQVKEFGVAFILFMPLPYVDLSSVWRIGSRWQRITIAAAGMMAETMIAASAILLMGLTDDPLIRHRLFNVVVAAGFTTILFNLNPLMRFDGYYILSDLLQMPNLYTRGVLAVRRLAGFPVPQRATHSWHRHVERVYGIAAFGWRIFVCITLLLTATTLFSGFGILLALAGVTFWIAPPIIKGYSSILAQLRCHPAILMRSAGMLAIGGIVSSAVLLTPLPSRVSVPAIVQPSSNANVRAQTDGVIHYLAIENGEHVNKGDLLVRLENRMLGETVADLRLQIELCDAQIRQATSVRDIGKIETKQRLRTELQKQLKKKQEDLERLVIRAPCTGRVIARNLHTLHGTFIHRGDAICVIEACDRKELLAMISEEKLPHLDPMGSATVVGMATPPFPASFDHLRPRGSTSVAHPAFAVTHGGALSVRSSLRSGDEPSELIAPHFEATFRFPMETAKKLRFGQTVDVQIGRSRVSLSELLTDQLDELVPSALRL